MAERIPIGLKDVRETLLLPLWGRAVESRKSTPLLIDTKAAEIINNIDYDFTSIARNTRDLSQLAWIGRALLCDKITSAFLAEHPRGTVVNLGCGLDTNFERIDNGSVLWYDLDLPDVIGLRRQFFPESERRKFLAFSIFDFSWIDRIEIRDKALFIAAGVLYYFDEERVKGFFVKMAEVFHGAEFLLDVASPAGVRTANKLVIENSGMDENALLKWGIRHPKVLESWDRDIQVKGIYSFFKDMRKRLSIRNRMGARLSDFLKIMYMIHLEIK